VLTVSETGYGRLSSIQDYRIQSRGGKGLLNYHVEKYGNVAAIKVVDLSDDIILIASDGVIIRIQADTIRECLRPSKGVLLMRIGEDNRVVTVARTSHDENETPDSLPETDGEEDEDEEETEDEIGDGEDEGSADGPDEDDE
jgi:DNA gyrase subunit A